MRVQLAVLIAVSSVCPVTAQSCWTPEVLTWESFTAVTPSPPAGSAITPLCSGWIDGWSRGWKDIEGEDSAPPLAPPCPAVECGRNTYADGYARGRVAGADRAHAGSGP